MHPTCSIRPRRTRRVTRTRASLVVGLVAGALAACGSSDAPPPEATRSVAATTPVVTAPSSAPATTTPATTAPPTTSPATTGLPPTTAPPAPSGRPIAAIDEHGDAVLVGLDGSTTLLLDGTDPDHEVDEGPVVLVDAITVTDDGSTAFVSECCEPSPGTWYRIDPAVGPSSASPPVYGRGLSLSPDGTLLASIAVDSVLVEQVVDGGTASLSSPSQESYPDQVAWANDGRLVVLDRFATGTTLRAIDVTFAGTLTEGPTVAVSAAPAGGAPTTMLAGRRDDVVYVADTTSPIVRAFDSTTLAPVAAADIVLDGPPLSVWIEDGEVRWVDAARALHVGATIVPGSYVWVR